MSLFSGAAVVTKTKQIINQLAESTPKLIKITGAFRATPLRTGTSLVTEPTLICGRHSVKSLLVFLLGASFYKKIYIHLKIINYILI